MPGQSFKPWNFQEWLTVFDAYNVLVCGLRRIVRVSFSEEWCWCSLIIKLLGETNPKLSHFAKYNSSNMEPSSGEMEDVTLCSEDYNPHTAEKLKIHLGKHSIYKQHFPESFLHCIEAHYKTANISKIYFQLSKTYSQIIWFKRADSKHTSQSFPFCPPRQPSNITGNK